MPATPYALSAETIVRTDEGWAGSWGDLVAANADAIECGEFDVSEVEATLRVHGSALIGIDTVEIVDAEIAFRITDEAWGAEVRRVFGKEAGEARYQSRGEGEPGSKLATLYAARAASYHAWDAARVAPA